MRHVAVALGAAYYANLLWGEKSPAPVSSIPSKPALVVSPQSRSEPSDEAKSLFSQARAHLAEAAKQVKEESEECQLLGRQHSEKALQYVQAACDLEPNWPEACCLKGQILQEQQGEWLLASAAYTASLRCDPKAAAAYSGRGFCKLMTGDFSGAKADFDEAIRLEGTGLAYECRAAAKLRLFEPVGSVADLRAAIGLYEEPAAKAALSSVIGLIYCDELNSAPEAIASLGAALQLLPADPDLDLRHVFAATTSLFGLTERFLLEPSANEPDGTLVRPVASVQRALWKACKAANGGCSRVAVQTFLGYVAYPHAIDDVVWKDAPDFSLHFASISAENRNANETLGWLKKLLSVDPAFDIRQAKRDFWLGTCRDPKVKDFLTPTWLFEEQHGRFFNQLTGYNLSPFRLTSIEITMTVMRSDPKRESNSETLDSLAPLSSHRWDNIFRDGGWFGGNISQVDVSLRCAEGEARLLVGEEAQLRVIELLSGQVQPDPDS